VIDFFDAMSSSAKFLTAASFCKSVTLIRAENNKTQLRLQIELAQEKSQSIHSQKSPQ